ncbi:MAG: aldehyde dehydrogenase family protein, partial [Deltaproteobacteria bacterium]
MAEIPEYRMYIGGEWVKSASNRTTPNINPANTDENLGFFQKGTREETRQAIEAAKAAFPAWRSTPAPARGRIVQRVVEIVRARKEELARLMTLEEGKILREARGEIEKGKNVLEFYAGEGFRIEGRTLPSEMPHTFTYTIRQPLGVVGLITPWNFPWAIPCWKIAPAIVAGNTVVFKPATLTPLTAVKLVEIFEEAGLPKGVLNMVTGSGGEVGDELVHHPDIEAISFTGSTETGRALYTEAAKGLKRVSCEMGGKNPAIVMEDANLSQAVAGVVQGAFGSTGQRCTATSRLILHRAIRDRFLEMLLAEVRKIKVGPGIDESSDMGPAVDEAQFNTDLEYIEIAQKEGATLLCGGKRASGPGLEKGYFVEPTIFTDVTPGMRIAREEVFGPVLAVLTVDSFEEAIRVANDCDFGLKSALYTQDTTRAMRFIEETDVGMTHINSPTIGGEAQLPFGGIKNTGLGHREMA